LVLENKATPGGHPDSLRFLGLDIGDRRIGVAVSDPTGSLASPVEVYQRRDVREDIQHVLALVSEYEASTVVVGLPKNMNGSEGPQAEKTREFAEMLSSHGLIVSLWDERLTTVEVTRRMTEQRGKRRGRARTGGRTWVDAEAAALILQAYLDYIRLKGGR